jgi:hypothetical protein
MAAGGFMIALIAGGSFALVIAVLAAFYLLSSRRRLTGSGRKADGSNPELEHAMRDVRADIEKGQRGF